MKWRLLCVIALLCAVVLGGREAYSQYKAYQRGQEASAQPEAAEDEKGASKAEEMKRINQILDDRNAYFTNSILSKIDPTREGCATADMIVRFDETEETAQAAVQAQEAGQAAGAQGEETQAAGAQGEAAQTAGAQTAQNEAAGSNASSDEKEVSLSLNVLNYYKSTAMTRSDLTAVGEALGEDPEMLRELITVSDSNKTDYMMTVKVIYPTQEGAEQILNSLLEQIKADQGKAEELYGPHTLLIANESAATIVDTTMFKWANTRVTEINALVNSRKSLDKNISAGTTAAKVEQIGKRDVVKAAAKSTLIGLFAGLFAAIVLVALWLLISGKVLSGRELNRQFGMYRIACVPGRKYGTLKGLDKLAASIDAEYYNSSKRTTCLQVADANLRGIARGGAQVALVGDLPEEYMDKVAAEMNKAAKANGSGTRYFAVSGSEQAPETAQVISGCDLAVLVACAGRSTYKAEADVLDMAELLDRKAVGSIVFM